MNEALEQAVETVLDRLGFELVELETTGHRRRPIVRLRIDRAESDAAGGVTVDECARVTRELEPILDVREDLPSSYILEVSSPGVERRIRKRRDFERYVGHEIAVRGFRPLLRDSRRLEGVLLGVEGGGEADRIRLRLADKTELEIRRSEIAHAQLIYRWSELPSAKKRNRKKPRQPDRRGKGGLRVEEESV